MAIKVESIPLGQLPKVFEKFDFDKSSCTGFLTVLMQRWRDGQAIFDLETAKECIGELPLRDMEDALFQLDTVPALMELSTAFRAVIGKDKLLSWTIKDHVILLELEK